MISRTADFALIILGYLVAMIGQRTTIITGLILIVAALAVTGTTYRDTGTLSMGIAVAAGICVMAGLALIITAGYLKKK